VDGLAFRSDDVVSIDEPVDGATTSLPMRVSWRTTKEIAEAHSADPGKPLFAVFVDQQPMPVGRTVAWVARNDGECEPPACPDAAYLAAHGIYLTTTTSVRVGAVLSTVRGRTSGIGQHELTVVLLDEHGRRANESAVTRAFLVRAAA
jgi:hypothetical protein